MKILVTGGAGFIGGNFVHYMVETYPEDMIVNLDLLTYAGNLETCKPVEGNRIINLLKVILLTVNSSLSYLKKKNLMLLLTSQQNHMLIEVLLILKSSLKQMLWEQLLY